MKRTTIIISVVAVILGAGTVYALMQRDSDDKDSGTTVSSQSGNSETNNSSSGADTSTSENGLTIVFTNNGFDKDSYSVKAGTVVTVKNESSMRVQFSSDDHPTHRQDPEINMGVLAPGKSGTFTPTTKGTHKFHDHINDQYTGTLEVK